MTTPLREMSDEELEAEDAKAAKIAADMRAVRRVIAAEREIRSVLAEYAKLPEAMRAAFAQIIAANGPGSTASVGTPGGESP